MPVILSGMRLTPARLARLQPTVYTAAASSTLALTTVQTDIPGCSVTFTTLAAGAVYVATGSFDFNQTATTASDCFGRLVVDGSTLGALAGFGGQVASDRATVANTWSGALGAAGSHTIKLAGRATANSQYECLTTSTQLVVTIYEVA